MAIQFPKTGRSRAEIDAALLAMAQGDADWRDGPLPRPVAFRSNLRGLLETPCPVMWNIEKTAR